MQVHGTHWVAAARRVPRAAPPAQSRVGRARPLPWPLALVVIGGLSALLWGVVIEIIHRLPIGTWAW
jgi:hypothetical protein